MNLQRHHNHHGAGPRSIPPPTQAADRPRASGSSREPPTNSSGPIPGRSRAAAPYSSSRPSGSSSRGGPPAHGYGEGRGQQYYPPKGVFYKPVRT